MYCNTHRKLTESQPHNRTKQIKVLFQIPKVFGFCDRRGLLEDRSMQDSGKSQNPSAKERRAVEELPRNSRMVEFEEYRHH